MRNLFSVVIPTRHRNRSLAHCLERLAPGAQTLSSDRYEVLVSDDGVAGDAKDLMETSYRWAKWIPGPRRGPAANRNAGASKATGDWLVFTDDDCLPDAGWLAAYAKAIEGDVLRDVMEGRTRSERPRASLAETAPLNESGGYLWSCNFAIRTALFQEVGGFDERFQHAAMEDMDLARRLSDRGYTPSFIREASVCHPWRKMKGWSIFKKKENASLMYLSLHPTESGWLNSRFYLKCFARVIFKEVLLGGMRYRGAGITTALLQSLAFLRMAFFVRNERVVSHHGTQKSPG